MFPTGNLTDELEIPGTGVVQATLVDAGIPTIFVRAKDIGYQGIELQEAINGDPAALARLEMIRACGALRMGLITSLDEAANRPHTPKLALIAAPQSYRSSSNKMIHAESVDVYG